MTLPLTGYRSIGSALLIKIAVPDEPVTYFTTYHLPLTVGSDTYVGLGNLISLDMTTSDLRVSPRDMTLTISGLNSTVLTNTGLGYPYYGSLIRGSVITIQRYLFDPDTRLGLSLDVNPVGRFSGIVSNFIITETSDQLLAQRLGSVVIVLTCSSYISLLAAKTTGRRTNSQDQRRFYPADSSMDRVTAIANANFVFGASQ